MTTLLEATGMRSSVVLTWRRLVGVMLLSVACVLLIWSVVQSGPPALDTAVIEALHQLDASWWVWFWHKLSVPTGVVAVYGVVIAGVLVLSRQHRWRLAASLVFLGLTAMHIQIYTKRFFARDRPRWDDPVEQAHGFSFPSGHALSATLVALIVVLVCWAMVRGRLRRILLGCAAGYVVLIGFDRLALGVHYPSDILAGFFTAVAWCALSLLLTGGWREIGSRGSKAKLALPKR
ncbi:MAG: phosphatase PAP2 family protein [Corynebacteriales bacterium]|nr:phosphatase PAP2 family protein [Mycobacteriales bacterium]